MALNEKPDVYGPLAQLAQRMLDWVAARETDVAMGVLRFQKQSRFEKEEVVYQGAALEAHLRAMGLERGAMDALWQAYQDARAEDEALQQGRDPSDPGPDAAGGGPRPPGTAAAAVRVGSKALGQISRIIQIVKLLFEASADGPRDFRLVFARTYAGAPAGGRRAFGKRCRGGCGGVYLCLYMCIYCAKTNSTVTILPLSTFSHSLPNS